MAMCYCEILPCGETVFNKDCPEHGRVSDSGPAAGCADDVERLTKGLQDIHNRLTGKGGNRKWVVGHIENLLAGRKHWEWE